MAVDRCVGIDWAKEAHRVCGLEADGSSLVEQEFTHDERDLGLLCELLVELGVKRVAIECPDGVLVGRSEPTTTASGSSSPTRTRRRR
jgi:Transposase